MKINFNKQLTNMDDSPAETPDKKPFLLKHVALDALIIDVPQPQGQLETGETKFKRFNLAQKINKGGEIEVTAEEITLMKERIGLTKNTLIVGKCWELLESR